MNERLEKEYTSYCDKHGIHINMTHIAQHFYNLALKDVRKEVERLKDVWFPVKNGGLIINRGPTSTESGALNALKMVKNFLDQLSK